MLALACGLMFSLAACGGTSKETTPPAATFATHIERGIPCLKLTIPAIDAHSLGMLFYFFTFSCYLSCGLLGVNPFDQPGVETYKGICSRIWESRVPNETYFLEFEAV